MVVGKTFAEIQSGTKTSMLISNADAKLYLGIIGSGEEDLITLLVNFASQAIKNFVGWDIEQTTFTDEIYDGGNTILRLRGKQISTSDFSLKYNSGTLQNPVWTAMSTNNYIVHYASGAIEFITPYVGQANIKVTYKAGYTTVPKDVQMVCAKFVARMYNKRKSEGLASETLESNSMNWEKELLSEDEKAILSQYAINQIV